MTAAGEAPSEGGRLERLRDLLLLLVAAVAAWSAVASFEGYVFEDSYITYRYADNLAEGQGFVFNPGERVLGTSTPLWTLLLAAGKRLTGQEIPVLAGWLFAAAWVAFALLGAALIRSRGRGNAGALFALACLWGAGGILLVWGMETALDVALLFAALAAARARREGLLGLLLGLAMITRFDTVLFAGLLLALVAWSERRVPWRPFLVATAVVLPWLIFSQLYFGAPFPHTLSAKAHDETTQAYLRGAVRQTGLAFFTPLLRFGRVPAAGYLPLVWLALMLPIPLALRRLGRGEPRLLVLVLFPLALWFAYGLIGPPVEHTWHMLPGMFLLVAAAALAWGSLFPGLEASRPVTLTAIALLLVSAVLLPGAAARERSGVEQGSEYGRRVVLKDELAGVIDALGLNAASLAVGEVGYLGYRSGCRMIDASGLITPGIRGHGPLEERTSLEQLAAGWSPDLFAMPTAGWPDLAGYRPLHTSVHLKTLYARHELVLARSDELLGRWLRPPRGAERGAGDGWPHAGEDRSGWWSSHDRRAFVDGEGWLFTSGRTTTAVTSPPFLIDFDELHFELGAAGCPDLRAELLVDGQVALRATAADGTRTEARAAGAEPRTVPVRWLLSALRGHEAVLQLTDSAPDQQLRAGAFEAVSWSRFVQLGGFEEGELTGWSGDFRATPAEELFERVGRSAVRGRHAAARLGEPGTGRMLSDPFEVRFDGLLVDLLNLATTPALLVVAVDGAEVLRAEVPPGSAWTGVELDLAAWRGRRATLAIEDTDPGPGSPLVDSIVLR